MQVAILLLTDFFLPRLRLFFNDDPRKRGLGFYDHVSFRKQAPVEVRQRDVNGMRQIEMGGQLAGAFRKDPRRCGNRLPDSSMMVNVIQLFHGFPNG
jgi:hypothetical protein